VDSVSCSLHIDLRASREKKKGRGTKSETAERLGGPLSILGRRWSAKEAPWRLTPHGIGAGQERPEKRNKRLSVVENGRDGEDTHRCPTSLPAPGQPFDSALA
jgi:hypothetical protein